ncbi:MAG: exosortase-associated EpsI family protein [Phycisphaerae bacterium]
MNKVIKEALRDRSFVIAGLVLLISAMSIQATAKYMKLHFRKERLELKKSLQQFDDGQMRPYRLVDKQRISKEVEEALGTSEYLQMRFEDPAIDNPNEFGKTVSLFVTYYTGDPDQVPHVPDVCYIGGGFDPAGSYDTSVRIPGLGLKNETLPVRVLTFKNTRNIPTVYQTVIYFFFVNGHYTETRDKVRVYQADVRIKYAYFSKVEVSFGSTEPPKGDKALELGEKFLNKALPILIKDHWANWEEINKK